MAVGAVETLEKSFTDLQSILTAVEKIFLKNHLVRLVRIRRVDIIFVDRHLALLILLVVVKLMFRLAAKLLAWFFLILRFYRWCDVLFHGITSIVTHTICISNATCERKLSSCSRTESGNCPRLYDPARSLQRCSSATNPTRGGN